MKLHRKQFTTLALAALATGFLGSATAQSAYPSKTVTMVVPTAAGGTTDLSARMLAQALGPVLGQTVVVDNKGGIKMVHVPYKGTGPALQDLLGGQVDLTFGTAPPFMPHIATGKLRVLAVTGKERLASLPDVPTTAEAGYPKVDATSWFAVFAPAAVPKPVVDRLTADIRTVVQSAAFKQKAQEQGATADYQSPAQLGDKVKADLANWAAVVKTSKIEAE
jgi:tripartite-type tricarboxylate transporter receptor subunit TctC